MNILKKTTRATKGFTLIETLVGITILLIAIAGPLYAIQKAVTAAYLSRDQLIANSLAQEGVEYIYAIRDINYLVDRNRGSDTISWMAGVDGTGAYSGLFGYGCLSPYNCGVDPFTLSGEEIYSCGGACPPLRIRPDGRYVRDVSATYPVTKFSRSFTITFNSGNPATATEALVTVIVTWQNNGIQYSATVEERLRNWL